MDNLNLENLIPPIAAALGLSQTTFLFYLGILVLFANALSRLIPEDSTGFLGFVRKLGKFISLNFSNRIVGNLTTSDITALIAAQKGIPVAPDRVAKVHEKVQTLLGSQDFPDLANESEKPGKLFPKVGRDPDTGKFVKLESSWLATLFAFLMVVLVIGGLSGCATMGTGVTQYACSREAEIRLGAQVGYLKAQQIVDPVQREAAISAINVTLAVLDKCPKAKGV